MGLADLAVFKKAASEAVPSEDRHPQRKLIHSPCLLPGLASLTDMAAFFAVAVLALASPLLAFDMGQSTRCVTIPNQMKVCKDVGYSEMRLPNFLGHSNLEGEVVPRSEDWRPLLQTGCHPQAQAFLCSIIAPVCLDT